MRLRCLRRNIIITLLLPVVKPRLLRLLKLILVLRGCVYFLVNIIKFFFDLSKARSAQDKSLYTFPLPMHALANELKGSNIKDRKMILFIILSIDQ
ncbi:hypothetical protein BCEP4_1870006 [Burkholderia cepacia]|nr:hypothetical protein BCEP4_1870006 [Burkholderia cepacia]